MLGAETRSLRTGQEGGVEDDKHQATSGSPCFFEVEGGRRIRDDKRKEQHPASLLLKASGWRFSPILITQAGGRCSTRICEADHSGHYWDPDRVPISLSMFSFWSMDLDGSSFL